MDPVLLEAGLTDAQGELVPLQHVAFDIRIQDGITEVNAEQTYRHAGTEPLEVVYTFPVATGALLLDLGVQIGGKTYTGQVVEKSDAEGIYEEAIDTGDFALLVEQVRPGLYTVNLGVLQPGDTVTVTLYWGMQLHWTGSVAELRLPTTVSNPYRAANKTDLMPHQEIVHDAFVELEYSLKCSVTGELARAEVQCLSHEVSVSSAGQSLEIDLTDKCAALDRDFVLNFFCDSGPEARANWCRLGDRYLGWIQLPVRREWCRNCRDAQPERHLDVFVESTPAMAGLGLRQAQAFVRFLVHGLEPQDRFNISTVGNVIVSLFSETAPATDEALLEAERFIDGWSRKSPGEADYDKVYEQISSRTPASDKPATTQVMLVLNDGMDALNVYKRWDSKRLPRLDVIGVGSAPTQFSLQALAVRSRGRFAIYGSRKSNVKAADNLSLPLIRLNKIDWTQAASQSTKKPFNQALLAGEVVNLFATFEMPPEGDIYIDAACGDRPVRHIHIGTWQENDINGNFMSDGVAGTHSPIVRMAANAILEETKDIGERKRLAIEYQLISRSTDYILRVERDRDGAGKEMPELRRVPHMHAAGKAGFGMTEEKEIMLRLKLQDSGNAHEESLDGMSLEATDAGKDSDSVESVVKDEAGGVPAAAEIPDDAAVSARAGKSKPAKAGTDRTQAVVKGLGGIAVVMLAALLLNNLLPQLEHIDDGLDISQQPAKEAATEGDQYFGDQNNAIPGQQRNAGPDLSGIGVDRNAAVSKLSADEQNKLYDAAVSDLKTADTVDIAIQKFRRLIRQNPDYEPESVKVYKSIGHEASLLYESERYVYQYKDGELERQPAPDSVIQERLKPKVPAHETPDFEYQSIIELYAKEEYLEVSRRYLRLQRDYPDYMPEPVRIFQRLKEMHAQSDSN